MRYLKRIKGDASFRKFYRKKNKLYNSIIVYAKKEKLKNLLIYDAINKVLIKNKILAPKLLNEKYNKNFIEVQDFGKQRIFDVLKKRNNKFLYFKKIIKILNQIQQIKDKNIKNFKDKRYTIPQYNKKMISDEANLFCDWYIDKKLSTKNKRLFKKKFNKIIKDLILNLKLKDKVFVHRDFHVSNLMLVSKQIGVIDSQDAVIGNRAYDLASLIDDVRLKTSISLKKKIFNFYIKKQNNLSFDKLKNDFEILSILRNLKIIGIFTRLAKRDGKKNYLKLIPHAWYLIRIRINKNKVFKDLEYLLNENFKRELYEN